MRGRWGGAQRRGAVVAAVLAAGCATGVVAPNAGAGSSGGSSATAAPSGPFAAGGPCAVSPAGPVGRWSSVCAALAPVFGLRSTDPDMAAPMVAPPGGAPLPCPTLPGVNDQCEKWATEYSDTTPYSNTRVDSPAAMVASPHGDWLYTAGTTSADGIRRLTVAAFDSRHGRLRWVAHGPSNPQSAATNLTLSRDGKRLYVTGWTAATLSLTSSPYFSFLTRAYSTGNGKLLWSTSFRGFGGHGNAGMALAAAPNGRVVYATGITEIPGPFEVPPTALVTIAYDARTGKQLWGTRFVGDSGQNLPVDLAVSPHGDRVYVTGDSQYLNPATVPLYRFVTIGYDTRHGRQLWRSYFNGTADGTNFSYDLALSRRGDRVFVTGSGQYAGGIGAPRSRDTTIAYAARNGRTVWRKGYLPVPGGSAVGSGLALAANGRTLYVAGSGTQPQSLAGQQLPDSSVSSAIAYRTNNGKRLWASTYRPTGLQSLATTVSVGSPNRIYVGVALGPSALTLSPGTVAYDAHGKQAWVARYDLRDPASTGTNVPVAQAVGRQDGAVYQLDAMAPATNTGEYLVCVTQQIRCTTEAAYPLLLAYAK